MVFNISYSRARGDAENRKYRQKILKTQKQIEHILGVVLLYSMQLKRWEGKNQINRSSSNQKSTGLSVFLHFVISKHRLDC